MVAAIQSPPDAAAIADPTGAAATAAVEGGFGGVLRAVIGQASVGDESAAEAGGSETPAEPLPPPAKDLASATADGSLAALTLLMFSQPQPLGLPPKVDDGAAAPSDAAAAGVATAAPEVAAESAITPPPAAAATPELTQPDAPLPADAPERATNTIGAPAPLPGTGAALATPTARAAAIETPTPTTPSPPVATAPAERAANAAAMATQAAGDQQAPIHAGKPARATRAGDASRTESTDTISNAPPDAAATTNTEGVVRFAGNAQDTTSGREQGSTAGKPAAAIGAVKRAEGVTTAAAPGDQRPAAAKLEAPAATDATAEAAPAATAGPAEQVAHAVVEQVRAGGGDAVIRLDPRELGNVSIRVHTDHNQVRIEVRAERVEALQVLRDSTPDLASLLNTRGLDLTNVSVSLGWSGGPGHGQQETPGRGRGPQPTAGEFANILGLDGNPAAERHNRLRSAYNPDGGHLYRV